MSPEPDTSEEQASDEGVDVPESFQQQAHALIHKATKPQLDHVSAKVSARHSEISKAEMEKSSKGAKGKVGSFSTEGMPSQY